MKVIPTRYNGHVFRSRTEARWAVFFREADIDYEYELEGFKLNGTLYLPDFWLPEPRWWIEIKGGPPTRDEKRRARFLMRESGSNVYLFCGTPANPEGGGFPVWTFPALGIEERNVRGQLVLSHLASFLAGMRSGTGILDDNGNEKQGIYWQLMGYFHYALDAARSARFEYGQSGPSELRYAWGVY